MLPVKYCLEQLKMTKDLQEWILDRRDIWAGFERLSSHACRTILTEKMEDAKLRREQRFMVFFLFSTIKTREKALRVMETMSPRDQAKPWFKPVKQFIMTNITDEHVSDVAKSETFSARRIMSCNPGLDLLIYCLATHPNERSIADFLGRPTASQLQLDKEMQKLAEFFKSIWDFKTMASDNPKAKERWPRRPIFEDDYVNLVMDEYKLVGANFKEIPPKDPSKGYCADEIVKYLLSFDPKKEYDKSKATLTEEMSELIMSGFGVDDSAYIMID